MTSPSPTCPFGARERERETAKRISNIRVFRDAGFALFEYRDVGY